MSKNKIKNQGNKPLNTGIITEQYKTFSDIKLILVSNIPFFLIILTIILVLYGATLKGEFLTADDLPGIVNNPQMQDFAGSWKTLSFERFYPATVIKLFGMNPLPFHIFSITFHFINSMLTFIFIYILFGKRVAAMTTLIFVTHPLATEAVSWISAHPYPVYTFITLLMLISFVLFRRNHNLNYLIFSAVVFSTSLIFYRKPWMLLSAVIVVIIDQFYLSSKIDFKKIWHYLWYAIPGFIYVLAYVIPTIGVRTDQLINLYYLDTTKGTPYINRVFYTTFMTLKQYIVPTALTIYHEGENVGSLTVFYITITVISAILVCLLSYLLWKSKNTLFRILAANILIIYTAIAFSYSPQVLVWSMADRYLYFGTIFFGLSVALLLIKLVKKSEYLMYVMGIILVLYSIKTFVRNFDWINNEKLWLSTQKISKFSYRVYNNLGDVYATKQDYDKALGYFQTSLQLNPKFADAVHNLGFTYYQKGNIDLAKQYFEKSLEMNPRLYPAAYKLGVIAYNQNDLQMAKQYFELALSIDPTYQPALQALQIVTDVINGKILPPTSNPSN